LRPPSKEKFGVISVVMPGGEPSRIDGFLGLPTQIDFRLGLDFEEALPDWLLELRAWQAKHRGRPMRR
jgi:hypothetical protein